MDSKVLKLTKEEKAKERQDNKKDRQIFHAMIRRLKAKGILYTILH